LGDGFVSNSLGLFFCAHPLKLKQSADDFRVEELTSVTPSEGPFALYRLDKAGWTTTDALAAVRRRWDVDLRRLSYGGLKDRHALTSQFFTIERGPRRGLQHHTVRVTYLGQCSRPFTSQDIAANRFTIVIRELKAEAAMRAANECDDVGEWGIPNYFDDQRFGSAAGGEFIGRLMVLGRYEEALKLALTAAYKFDNATQKREKAALRRNWGKWRECRAALGRGHARSLADYLAQHPDDFRGAVARLRPDLQGLYLAAYQSFVWNRMLSAGLREQLPADWLVGLRLKVGDFALPVRRPPTWWQELELPLPSARLKPASESMWWPWLETALTGQGFSLGEMKLPGLRRPFFTHGNRAAFVVPRNLCGTADPDDRHPARHRLRLTFELPRGSYATIVVKRLTLPACSDPHAVIP